MPLDGDISEVVLPSPGSAYYQVLQDPFGIGVLVKDTSYANPNRFFAHYSASMYLKHAPLIMQTFVSPVNSIYLASAILKTMVQIIMIYLLALSISRSGNIFSPGFLLAAVLITPLFQASGYNSYMGIIDQSITYTFFYALPLTLLLLFFMPFYQKWMTQKPIRFNWITRFFLFIMIIILSFNGPLVPGIVVIICPLILLNLLIKYFTQHREFPFLKRVTLAVKEIPFDILFFFLLFLCTSLYSLYLGTHNLLNASYPISLIQKYQRLPLGFYYQFTEKAGFPLMFLVIAANLILIRKRFGNTDSRQILIMAKWIGIFSLLYIVLLPMGGFRIYRPHILRYDTILPVTIAVIFLFGFTTYFMIRQLSGKLKYLYIAVITIILLIFTRADEPRFSENSCEKMAIEVISASSDTSVELDYDCRIMAWAKITDPKDSEMNARLMHYWRITSVKRLYYQR
jgi:hypothetical protein